LKLALASINYNYLLTFDDLLQYANYTPSQLRTKTYLFACFFELHIETKHNQLQSKLPGTGVESNNLNGILN